MFAVADHDNDGFIGYKEFMVSKYLVADHDNDGYIGYKEFMVSKC